MKTNLFVLFIIFIMLISCKNSYKVDELYIQKIQNSNKVIYKYNGWVGNSQFWGSTIKDSTEKLSIPNADEIPITILKNMPNKDTVNIIYLKWHKKKSIDITENEKRYTIDANGIECIINEYEQINGNSKSDCSLVAYNFKNFKESKDSLFLYGVETRWSNISELPDTIGFPKGNITIFENYKVKNEVIRLIIEELKLYSSKGCLKTYYFYPDRKIYSYDFSDYGIFKKNMILINAPNICVHTNIVPGSAGLKLWRAFLKLWAVSGCEFHSPPVSVRLGVSRIKCQHKQIWYKLLEIEFF